MANTYMYTIDWIKLKNTLHRINVHILVTVSKNQDGAYAGEVLRGFKHPLWFHFCLSLMFLFYFVFLLAMLHQKMVSNCTRITLSKCEWPYILKLTTNFFLKRKKKVSESSSPPPPPPVTFQGWCGACLHPGLKTPPLKEEKKSCVCPC